MPFFLCPNCVFQLVFFVQIALTMCKTCASLREGSVMPYSSIHFSYVARCSGGQLCISSIKSGTVFVVQLIHMDLKSKNVVLTGRKDLATIADVGVSRIIQSTLGGQSSTPFGVGTFEYTAPEILLGRQCNEKASLAAVIPL